MNGRAVNLISNDLDKLFDLVKNNADLYKGPIETLVYSVFIYRSMGLPGLTGVFFILCFVPFQTWFGDIMSKHREKISKFTDQRLQFISEVINGIQLIKLYGWENSFTKMMEIVRGNEVEGLEKSWFIFALLMSLRVVAKLSMFLSLAAYVLAGNILTAEKVFMLSFYYFHLNDCMVQFWPLALKEAADGFVCIRRIEEFLLENRDSMFECSSAKVDDETTVEKGSISVINATGSWSTDIGQKSIGIDTVNLKIKPQSLNFIVGRVGSGKSSLLLAIINELKLEKGSVQTCGEISYATQIPWLFNESIKNNILFSETFDENRYQKVLKACALERDLKSFLKGDETIVSERGTSLSGGQKARINLARAVYKKADIYLLDDVLSAVDANVGNQIFNECFKKFLEDKTVVLITHQLGQYLKETDEVVVMKGGRIESKINPKEQKNSVEFQRILSYTNDEDSIKHEVIEEEMDIDTETIDTYQHLSFSQNLKNFLSAAGSKKFIAFIAFLVLSTQIAHISIDKFLTRWSDWEQSVLEATKSEARSSFLLTYTFLIVFLTFACYKSYVIIFSSLVKASHKLHNQMFEGMIQTSMEFFHKNTSGNILARFSKDVSRLDQEAPEVVFSCIAVRSLNL